MSGAPVGRVVGLYMDTTARLREGDVLLREATDSGRPARAYRIVSVRTQLRGEHEGRQHLQALVIAPESIEPADRVVKFVWYPRARRRRS